LIHQPAGFAEEFIFRIPACLAISSGGDLSAAEKFIQNGSDQNLKGGRGRHSGARGDAGDDAGAKSACGKPKRPETGCDAPHQRSGAPALLRLGRQPRQIHPDFRITLGTDADFRAAGRSTGCGVQIHSRGQYMAALMIRVISTQL
jgi:hypothetical protein